MLGKLDQILSDHSTRLISVDFFDTVLLRGSEAPHARYLGAARRAARELANRDIEISAAAIFAARLVATRAAGGLSHALHGPEDVPIARIFELAIDAVGLPQDCVDTLLAAEIAEEMSRLSLNSALVSLLKRQRAKGTRIVVTSDTNLSPDMLVQLLRGFGIADLADKVRTSSDCGVAKYSGRLFEQLLEDEAMPASHVVHVGDDPVTDVSQPSRLGIRAIHVPRGPMHTIACRVRHGISRRTLGLGLNR